MSLLLLLSLAAAPARAQYQPSVGPQDLFGGLERGPDEKPARERPADPFVRALHEAFPPGAWLELGLSTSAPLRQLGRWHRGGSYRLELVLLTLGARKSGKRLPDLLERREKGSALRDLARELGLDYDALYDEALALKARLDRAAAAYEPAASTGTAPGSSPPSGAAEDGPAKEAPGMSRPPPGGPPDEP